MFWLVVDTRNPDAPLYGCAAVSERAARRLHAIERPDAADNPEAFKVVGSTRPGVMEALLREIAAIHPDDDGDVMIFADETGHNPMITRIREVLDEHPGALGVPEAQPTISPERSGRQALT